jgi:hypothetical protein
MAHITLYRPGKPTPEEYDNVEDFGFKDGRLIFIVGGVRIITTVPYVIKQSVDAETAVTEHRAGATTPRRGGWAGS